MKISKLFHWLYAILMLLPFAFFVPSVLYYAFNDNATMQSVEVPKTVTVGVDFNQKYNGITIEGTRNGLTFESTSTYFTLDGTATTTTYFSISNFPLIKDHKYLMRGYGGMYWTLQQSSGYSLGNKITQAVDNYPSNSIAIRVLENTTFVDEQFTNLVFDLTQMFGVGNEPTLEEFNLMFPNTYYPYTESELMQITYDTGETEQLVENTSIINYAWESIWDLPLFSWTKITFVSVPFSYLTGIFGLGASNSLNYLFGYFVTISIVWLVFDLLLYVPMLAHNWIDKARIE